jgi:hypothetical protein
VGVRGFPPFRQNGKPQILRFAQDDRKDGARKNVAEMDGRIEGRAVPPFRQKKAKGWGTENLLLNGQAD